MDDAKAPKERRSARMTLTLDKIYHAAHLLKPVIRLTDVIAAPHLVEDCSIYLKTENLQKTGSFKLRGSYYKISQLTDEQRAHGIVACSAGNHAQGVAMAAAKQGIVPIICLPDAAPISKIEATKSYGADVRLISDSYDDAYAYARSLQQEEGYTFIHPFDDVEVMAGQGTIGLELLDQLPDLDAVIVPVGGGGLIAGIAYVIKHLAPHVKVYGVQATGAASMVQSLAEDQCEVLKSVSTIADGIAVKTPGTHTFALCKQYVDEVVVVTEDEIATAILAIMEQQKLITEGAGAVSVAAALFHKLPLQGKKVVCLLSGGNIDVTMLSRVVSRGLLSAGRSAHLTISLIDKPGQLKRVVDIIARSGANVVAVHHDRVSLKREITDCILTIAVETRNHLHVQEIEQALTQAGVELIAKE